MEVHCIRCRRYISRQFIENHYRGPKCTADMTARVLLAEPYNFVPYPRGHDLPGCVPSVRHVTRARYEGTRLDVSGAVIPVGSSLHVQVWVPAWVRVIEGAWARLGRARKNRRDRLLCAVKLLRTHQRQLIVDTATQGDVAVLAFAEQLTGVAY